MAPVPLIQPAVLELLADGAWHSGVALGRALGLSRAAIWKQVRSLRSLGLTVAADRRQGYRLSDPLDLLDGSAIRTALAPATLAALESLDVMMVTASTNEYLATRPAPPPGRIRVATAEYQTGGRGRRGRRWLSPLGHGICLSVSWCFEVAPRDLPALSLAVGVAVTDGLASLGVDDVQLKWPNDIMGSGGKLGGILVEVSGESGGPLHAVIGIGLNVRPVGSIAADLLKEGGAAPAASLDELAVGRRLGRSVLVAALLNALHASLWAFGDGGVPGILAAWRQRDCLAGQPVAVTRGRESFLGIARGIADDGALLVERNGTIVPVVAGDVTLRAS